MPTTKQLSQIERIGQMEQIEHRIPIEQIAINRANSKHRTHRTNKKVEHLKTYSTLCKKEHIEQTEQIEHGPTI